MFSREAIQMFLKVRMGSKRLRTKKYQILNIKSFLCCHSPS